ncbi:hypothetical protein LJC48_03195 [Desulfovibrio sp. OttesenSCG-928-C06]|nr:hypothetical protein [Desulfovibrio sp. OttesenSCG-928-C06]
MKIQNDYIKALQQQAEAQQKPQTGQVGQPGLFDGLLSSQLQHAGTANSGSTMSQNAGLMQTDQTAALAVLMQTQASADSTAATSGESAEAAERIGSLLDQWDQYAAALSGNSGADLRGVYGMLQGMTQNVRELKSSMSGLLEQDPNLAAMVNELDVMTTTETIKFNRGDYI